VDWYPWGPEALEKSRCLGKPVFLSIGYAACHWCHVMERESFEDERVAAFLNEHFVAIKVDREERPDLDEIYMNATQLLTGSGGWPLTAFLTPSLEPFFCGTYFPPEDRHGRSGFLTLLKRVHEAWTTRREEIEAGAGKIADSVRAAGSGGAVPAGDARRKLISLAKRGLAWVGKKDGRLAFRLAPFIVGIYEAQASTIDHELAHLVEQYMTEGGAAGIMGPEPATAACRGTSLRRCTPGSAPVRGFKGGTRASPA
jgi:hypothetical protein